MAIAGTVVIPVEPGLSGFGSKVEAATRLLKPIGLNVEIDDRFGPVLRRSVNQAQRDLDSINTSKAQRELNGLGSGAANAVRQLKGLSGIQLAGVGGGLAAGGVKALQALTPAVEAASELNETLGSTEVTFGDAMGSVSKIAEGAADSMGLSQTAALKAMDTFGLYAKMVNKTGEDAVGFAEDLARRAADLGARKGFGTEEVVDMFGAAMRGEMDPIERVGVMLNENILKEAALREGLIKTKTEALDPSTKAWIVYQQILEQTADSQGQFDREREGFAGREKVRSASLANQQAELGKHIEKVWAGGSAALLKFTSLLDKIPGGLAVTGVALAGLGGTAILGGAITSILGARKAIVEYRAESAAAVGEQTKLAGASTTAGTAGAAAGARAAAGMGQATAATEAATAATMRYAAALGGVSAAGALDAGPEMWFSGAGGTATNGMFADKFGLPRARINADDIIDVEVIDTVSSLSGEVLELGSGLEDAGRRGAGLGSKISSGVRSAGSAIGSAAGATRGWLNGLGGFGQAAVGIAALTVATEGFSFAIAENKRQAERGLAAWVGTGNELAAAFDPSKPAEFNRAAAETALILNRAFDPGNWNAADVFKGWGGIDANVENQTDMIVARMEQLKGLVGTIPTDKLRAFGDMMVKVLNANGGASEEAAKAIAEYYDEIDQYESVQRATGAIDEATDAVDRFGFKVGTNRGKFGQFADSFGSVLGAVRSVADASKSYDDALDDVADAEAEVARLRADSTGATQDAKKAVEELAEAHRSVESAIRSVRKAERDLADARRDRDAIAEELKRVDPQRDPNRYRELSEKLRDADDDVLDAQDRVADANDSKLNAQSRLNDARAQGVSKADDLAKAEDRLKEAIDRARDAELDRMLAWAEWQEFATQYPEATAEFLRSIDEMERKGLLSAEAAKRMRDMIYGVGVEASKAVDAINTLTGAMGKFGSWLPSGVQSQLDFTPYPLKPTGATTTPTRPAVNVTSTTSSKTPAVAGYKSMPQRGDTLSKKAAEERGLFVNQINDSSNMHVDSTGLMWKWDPKRQLWAVQLASGGRVPGNGYGDTVPAMLTPGEQVLNRSEAAEYRQGFPKADEIIQAILSLPALLAAVLPAPLVVHAEPSQVEQTVAAGLRASRSARWIGA